MTTKRCVQLFEKKLNKVNQRQACQTGKWAMYACADQLQELKSDANCDGCKQQLHRRKNNDLHYKMCIGMDT